MKFINLYEFPGFKLDLFAKITLIACTKTLIIIVESSNKAVGFLDI